MATTSRASTLLSRLREHVERRPTATAYTFLDDDVEVQRTMTFADLGAAVQTVAANLLARLRPGDRALLLLPEGLDFVPIFLGCLQAGVIAVPAYPPSPVQSRLRVETLRAIVKDCQPDAVVASAPEDVIAEIKDVVPEMAGVWWASSDTLTTTPVDDPIEELPDPERIAFLQYTSGSTSMPKGVVVPHAALVHNEELIRKSMEHDEDLTTVGWLPLFHDMGLIGIVLNPIWLGGQGVLMAPRSFIKRPARWLWAISRYGGTTSGAPNFAFDMCTRRIRDSEIEGLDLSSLRVAFNGAEPVRAQTLHAFGRRFAPYGLDTGALYACYGLAEATLLVTGTRVGTKPQEIIVDTDALQHGKVVLSQTGRTLVSSGFPRIDREVLIVDPDTHEPLDSDHVGEIWIGGPGLPTGYWGNPGASNRTFAAEPTTGGTGPCMRSGDLGFLHRGELYVTGRIKDVIILGGKNHYPQDIEDTAEEAHASIRTGCVASFSVVDDDAERVVVVVGAGGAALGSSEAGTRKRGNIVKAVRAAVATDHGITVDDVVITGPNAVPKTSSGKVQRGRCRAAYLAGEFAHTEKRQKESP
ncbi:fatty acyl-AMP ligase [Haloactinomyces albus]|uniref:Acyl-CoA synthetase (AMP-forming)/AMP-acid ligase II n=1 Tax=Haloactinomyces albus TaxID=1352928 RepID=A0AAE4CRG4_9ACTN|nr:fatty acyl-AMP ligase [Haloactinomyces albus]MDR7303688.1 acyl-CoA synthetase (AMP-forming)/AMP-acid ligase II [Haloactinomyces albus]